MADEKIGPGLSRRGVFGAAGGAALVSLVASEAGADGALIALIAQFDALQRQCLSRFPPDGSAIIRDDDARTAANEPLQEAQAELLDEILEMRATTPAGFVARARMLIGYDRDILNPQCIYGWDQAMIAALVRDMAMPEWKGEISPW